MTPASEPDIGNLGPSVSFNVSTYNWGDRGEY